MTKPQPPYLYRVLQFNDTFELNDLGEEIIEQEKVNQTAWERACKIQSRLVKIRHEMEMGNIPLDSMHSLESLEQEILEIHDANRRESDGITSGVVEDYVRAKSFLHFLDCLNSFRCESHIV